ncbi:MAG: CPBP family glutamic-type intramembrane protease, partial [Verrucomicrobiota bacterium]
GAYKWSTLAITVVLFVLIHQPADYFGAFVYGSLACWVAIRTRSLFACVWMHAIANLILGLYIMWSRNWGLW